MAVAHLAFDLGPRHQRRNRVDHQHVDRVRPHQCIDDLQGLLAGVGLRHNELVDVDAQFLGVRGIKRMLGIDECGAAADFLGFGDGVQSERRLARALGAVNLDHPPTREAADAQRDIEAEAAGGGRVDLHLLAAAEPHRRALAEGPVDLRERRLERLLPIHIARIQTRCDDLELR